MSCFNDGSIFGNWANILPTWMMLYRDVISGQRRHFAVPLLIDFVAAKEFLTGQTWLLANRPFIILGHNLSDLIAYEIARTLTSHVGAYNCRASSFLATHHRPIIILRICLVDRTVLLLHRLLEVGGLPVIHADLAIYDSLALEPDLLPLDYPLLALSGNEDDEASTSSITGLVVREVGHLQVCGCH
ncbi:MAG: hypothetical protein AAGB04_14955 [Pseudomonadota bacterium]